MKVSKVSTVAIASAIALVFATQAAQAGQKLPKEEKVGMASGAVVGAVVGGPIGAFVGFMAGGIFGESQGKQRLAEERAASLEQDLTSTRLALARASAKKDGGDEMFDALAERMQADVLFKTASTELEAGAQDEIEQLGKLLASHSQLKVELQGFADPRGKKDENVDLSQRRAETVRDALVKGGASSDNIVVIANGAEHSTATKGDLEAYAWERHVTLKIHSGDAAQVAQAR
jgi:outer membrane protein OmpA-like peptidoglycan-associated protein